MIKCTLRWNLQRTLVVYHCTPIELLLTDAQRRTRQGSPAKNLPSLPTGANKWTADQAFHDATTQLVPDSQLQNELANLERQVLEAKKAALQSQLQTLSAANPAPPMEEPTANPREGRTSNFGSL